MKICSKCKQDKPLFDFGKHSRNKDGLQYYCKTCRISVCAKSFSKISDEIKSKRNASTRKWKQENKDFVYEYNKKYKSDHSNLMSQLEKKRQIRLKNATPSWLTEFDLLKMKCYYQVASMYSRESSQKWSVDHIIPLQGKNVCGLHVPSNLRIIPTSENTKKSNLYKV